MLLLRVILFTGSTFASARVPWMWQLLFVYRLQVVSALPLLGRDSIRSFPVGAELPLGGVFSGAYDPL